MGLFSGASTHAPPSPALVVSTVVERWAADSLCGLAIGTLVPLSVSAVREVRQSRAAGDDGLVLYSAWAHRLLDIGWSVGSSLDAAASHSKLLMWSAGDTSLIVTAQALAWTAAAAARLLGPFPGWSSVVERHPRTVWALGKLGMAVDHAAWLRCGNLVSWARLHAACCCFAPMRSGLTAQGVCWQATVGASVGPVRAAELKKATGNWSGAAGFAAAWWGARLVRANRGDLAHTISVGLYVVQAVAVFCTPKMFTKRRHNVLHRGNRGGAGRGRVAKRPVALNELARVICDGPNSRWIAVAAACGIASDSARICADALCLGLLGWRPTELAVYGGLASCAGNVMQTTGCTKALEMMGLRNTSVLGTVLASVGAIGMVALSVPLRAASGLGVSLRAATTLANWTGRLLALVGGASAVYARAASLVGYGVMDHVLMRAWGGSQGYATQLLFVETLTPVLGGRRNAAAAAFDALTQLVTLIAPAGWAVLYSRGWRFDQGSVIWGPLGTVVLVSASLRICGSILMSRLVTVEPAHGWETARGRTTRMRGLLDPTAPAGFPRAQRTYASIAQKSGVQVFPRAPKPRQRATGKIPATVQQPRPWSTALSSKHQAAVNGVETDGGASRATVMKKEKRANCN